MITRDPGAHELREGGEWKEPGTETGQSVIGGGGRELGAEEVVWGWGAGGPLVTGAALKSRVGNILEGRGGRLDGEAAEAALGRPAVSTTGYTRGLQTERAQRGPHLWSGAAWGPGFKTGGGNGDLSV